MYYYLLYQVKVVRLGPFVCLSVMLTPLCNLQKYSSQSYYLILIIVYMHIEDVHLLFCMNLKKKWNFLLKFKKSCHQCSILCVICNVKSIHTDDGLCLVWANLIKNNDLFNVKRNNSLAYQFIIIPQIGPLCWLFCHERYNGPLCQNFATHYQRQCK